MRFQWLMGIGTALCVLCLGLSMAAPSEEAPGVVSQQLLTPSSPAAQADSRLTEYFRGVSLYRAGQWAQAASVLEALLRNNPEFSSAAGAAADAYRKLQQPDKAQYYYTVAARLCEENLQRRAQLALNLDIEPLIADLIYYLYRLKQWDTGWKLLESLERATRENLAGLAGMLLIARGKVKEGRDDICRAVRKNPRDPRLLEFMAEARDTGREIICPEERPPDSPGQAYALMVGIGQYQDKAIPELTYPVPDALCIRSALQNQRSSLFKKENITILLDREAASYAIQRELLLLEKKVTEQDLVMICFAGHAAWVEGNPYWITHDAQVDRISATGFAGQVIANFLLRCKARRAAVFVDGSPMGPALTAASGRLKTIGDLAAARKDQEIVSITASTGAQRAEDLKRIQHGALSPFLCEILQGNGDENRDGIVDINEAWSYIKSRLRPPAGDREFLQAPVMSGASAKGFAIAKNPLKR